MLTRLRHRLKVWKHLRPGKFVWNDTELHFPPTSAIAAEIMRSGMWEREIVALLATAAKPGTTIFDVGANIGVSVIPLLVASGDIRVVSFEPSPSVLPYLLRTHAKSRFRDRWEIVSKAVTAKANEEIEFVTFPPGSDVYEGIRNTGRGGAGTVTRVATTTLDAEWKARNQPKVSLVKIDVEGAELGVLEGALECLSACRPVIVTEWATKNLGAYQIATTAILDLAQKIGYRAYVIPELYPVTDRYAFELQMASRENLLLAPT
jgi:FkbM family methyltransferase